MPRTYRIDILVWDGDSSRAAEVRRMAEETLGPGFLVGEVFVPGTDRETWQLGLEAFLRGDGDCLLTVGGAGYAAGDCVPDLTASLLRRSIPGIPEAFREAGAGTEGLAALYRGVAGLTGEGRLLVNLPEGREWLGRCLSLLARILPHALDKAQGDTRECGGEAP